MAEIAIKFLREPKALTEAILQKMLHTICGCVRALFIMAPPKSARKQLRMNASPPTVHVLNHASS